VCEDVLPFGHRRGGNTPAHRKITQFTPTHRGTLPFNQTHRPTTPGTPRLSQQTASLCIVEGTGEIEQIRSALQVSAHTDALVQAKAQQRTCPTRAQITALLEEIPGLSRVGIEQIAALDPQSSHRTAGTISGVTA
jgi:hypothetical protein